MNLQNFIRTIAIYDEGLTIFVAPGDLTGSTEVVLVNLDEDEGRDQLTELIDVWHAHEILDGVSNLNPELKAPDAEERLTNRFIEYMHNDA